MAILLLCHGQFLMLDILYLQAPLSFIPCDQGRSFLICINLSPGVPSLFDLVGPWRAPGKSPSGTMVPISTALGDPGLWTVMAITSQGLTWMA